MCVLGGLACAWCIVRACFARGGGGGWSGVWGGVGFGVGWVVCVLWWGLGVYVYICLCSFSCKHTKNLRNRYILKQVSTSL